jgi:hypothetical protein
VSADCLGKLNQSRPLHRVIQVSRIVRIKRLDSPLLTALELQNVVIDNPRIMTWGTVFSRSHSLLSVVVKDLQTTP